MKKTMKAKIASDFSDRHTRFDARKIERWIEDYLNPNFQNLYPEMAIPWTLCGSPQCSWTKELKQIVDNREA